jgi:predicted  nucleic acid-binding Zn-ribbon protein
LSALADRYDQQTRSHTQWLQHEWDAAKPRIEELCKSTGQLETELESEQAHAQWLQNEWNAARQRIEELFKSTGQLEAELASEQAHAQWLQNEWDTDRQRGEELRKATGQLETQLNAANEQIEELNKNKRQLEIELNTVNEHNSQLQAHAQWLQNELDAVTEKVNELNHSSHHWWTVSDQLNQELRSIYASKFWRITWPLRKIMQIAKWALALPARIMRWTIRLPKRIVKPLVRWSMRKTLNNPDRKKHALNMLAKYPRLKQHLRLFAMNSGLIAGPSMASATSHSSGSSLGGQSTVSTAYSPGLPETSISNLSPRAAIIYAELKRSIDARKN